MVRRALNVKVDFGKVWWVPFSAKMPYIKRIYLWISLHQTVCYCIYLFFFKLSCRLNNTVTIAKDGKRLWTGNVFRMCEKGMRTEFCRETSLIMSKLSIVKNPKKKRIFMKIFCFHILSFILKLLCYSKTIVNKSMTASPFWEAINFWGIQ
jgi:hypothetical protein